MSTTVRVHAAVIRGIEALPITVEVSLSSGIPGISIVGSADNTIQESRSRIRCAFKDCGFSIPRKLVTVNLSPSEIRKSGTGLDLPIAMGILVATGQISQELLRGRLFVGEVGLDGSLHGVRGTLAYAMLAREQGLTLVAPELHKSLGTSLDGTCAARHLRDARSGFSVGDAPSPSPAGSKRSDFALASASLDYADVVDQEIAKRAFVISAVGNHGVLMMGPPGSGKTMLARRMPTILPPLTAAEQEKTMLIHSVCGLDTSSVALGARPFRAPHHSISKGGLLGGGRPVLPGEISLAHNGVLFLDELPEFNKDVLQSLRQPLEDKEVRLVRVDGVYTFPCSFLLVAAANPCPCGHYGDPGHECSCSESKINAYQGRIGGPLMDRIDVHVDVKRPSSEQIIQGMSGMSSKDMAELVEKGRQYASWRLRDADSLYVPKLQDLSFDGKALKFLQLVASRYCLGGRALNRLARVARTIADIEESQHVKEMHVLEASGFRPRSDGGGEAA